MKLKTPYKTVMFYGNALHIPSSANWVAANTDGRIKAYVEEPHVSHGFWEAETGAIWSIDASTKFGDENWKNTLTYCPRDQQWMIEAAAKLDQAWDLHTDGLLPREAKEQVLNRLVDILPYRAEGRDTLQATWDSWMKHAVPGYLHDEDITYALYDRLFPKPKEPEYCVVKDYYGRDIIVPPQTRWIAMDINGSTYTYETAPVRRVGCWRENINGEEEHIPVSWYPPEVARLHWQDSLREVQP